MTAFRRGLLLLVTAAATTPRASLHAQSLADAERFLAAGDTVAAIGIYESIVAQDLHNAEAHYRAGVLYMAQHVAGRRLSEPRRRAEEHFRYATRFEADSAKYWLALAALFRGEDNSFTRMQVPRLIARAREAAVRVGNTDDVGALEYQAARSEWERYEHFGRRYLSNEFTAGMSIDTRLFHEEWRYVEDFFRERVRRTDDLPGEEQITKAERHLRAALEAEPRSVDAAGLLLVVMAEQSRWPEAHALTRTLIRTAPDSGRAWALLGTALVREQRWLEAGAAFDSALRLMTPWEREPYENLGQIMRSADRVRFDQLTPTQRATLDSTYWTAAQPLALTETNELRVEFYARITYVLHRWSDPLLGYRGHETDIGAVYVRYGPPDIWAVFNRSLVAWVYRYSRIRFLFRLQPGFVRARFAGDSREALRTAAQQSPARFDNVPVYRTLDTILVQTAQFRGEGNRPATSVVVFGAIPVRRMVDSAALSDLTMTSAAILTDTTGRELGRSPRNEVLRGAGRDREIDLRTWQLTLAPREYQLRVEAHIPVLTRGARGAGPLRVRGYWGTTDLMLSDVLVANDVAPRDSTFTRWSDFFIEPSAGRYGPDDPLALLWEIYNLAPDSTGRAHYTVDLTVTVEALERRTFIARVLGGIGDAVGLSALGDDHVELSYERAVPVAPGGTQVEYLTLDLQDAPEGTYGLTVTITDRVSGRSASRASAVTVSAVPLQRVR